MPPHPPCLERFLHAFQVPDVVLRMAAEDAAHTRSVVGLMTRGLAVCLHEWQGVMKADDRLTGRDVEGLLPVLRQVKTLICHPWADVDQGLVFDWLSPLFIELTFHLARVLSLEPRDDYPAARQEVAWCLGRCIEALSLQGPYPNDFKEQLRRGLIEPRNLPLLLVFNEFDRGLRVEFNRAYLGYLASLANGSTQVAAERTRDFLDHSALLYWTQTVQFYENRSWTDEIADLAAQVIPPVFEAIHACDDEPIDVVPRLLRTLRLMPSDRLTSVRRGLEGVLRQMVDTHLVRWRRRAASDPDFRTRFDDAMAWIRPALEGTARTLPDRRPLLDLVYLIPAQATPPRTKPADGESIVCRGVNITDDLSGIQIRVDLEHVADGGSDIWLKFPDGNAYKPDGCRVLLGYVRDDGCERVLVARFIHRWHRHEPHRRSVDLGGRLEVVSDPAEADACRRRLRAATEPHPIPR